MWCIVNLDLFAVRTKWRSKTIFALDIISLMFFFGYGHLQTVYLKVCHVQIFLLLATSSKNSAFSQFNLKYEVHTTFTWKTWRVEVTQLLRVYVTNSFRIIRTLSRKYLNNDVKLTKIYSEIHSHRACKECFKICRLDLMAVFRL